MKKKSKKQRKIKDKKKMKKKVAQQKNSNEESTFLKKLQTEDCDERESAIEDVFEIVVEMGDLQYATRVLEYSEDKESRLEAVKKISKYPELLTIAACQIDDEDIRLLAVRTLRDIPSLQEVVDSCLYYETALAAEKRIQEILRIN